MYYSEYQLSFINVHLLIRIKPNQVQQLPPAHQVVESPAKKKKQKSKRKSADLDNCNEVKIKKRKLSSKFEPVATSSTRKKDIVESRVQYFNNLSNSNENSNIAEHDVGTEVVPEKLNNQLISQDLITPALSSKSTKKKKEKKLSEQMEISNEEKACELNNIKSNVPHQQLIHNDDSNAFKTPVDKMNNLSNNVHPKLIQHMTPLRNMLPTTVIKEKIHVIRNIVMSRDKDTILEENKCNNVSEVVTKKSADIVSVTTSDLNGNANSIGENSDSKNDEQVEEPQISKPDEQECLPSTSTIKNERVSLPVSTNTLTEVPEVQSNEIMDETPQRNSECKTISTAIPLKCSEKRLQSSMSYILSSLKSDCSSTSNSIDGNDCEEVKEKFITRRKRHRTRKNKPIHKDTPAPIKFSDFRRPNIQSKPLIHRFFAEEPIEIPSTDTEECNKIEQKSSDKPENVTILDLTEETPEIFENPLPVPLNGQKKSYLDTKLEICGQPLTQEFIDKLTVMSNVVPTRGDIIIFQVR